MTAVCAACCEVFLSDDNESRRNSPWVRTEISRENEHEREVCTNRERSFLKKQGFSNRCGMRRKSLYGDQKTNKCTQGRCCGECLHSPLWKKLRSCVARKVIKKNASSRNTCERASTSKRHTQAPSDQETGRHQRGFARHQWPTGFQPQ